MRFSAAALLTKDTDEIERAAAYRPRQQNSTLASHIRRNSLQRRAVTGNAQFVVWQDDDAPQRPKPASDIASQHHHNTTRTPPTHGPGRMPPLRDDRNNGNNAKPLMPSLAQKRNVKSPITPRLAAGGATATPPTLAKQAGRSNTPGTVRSPGPTTTARDELATPAKAFISSNVTPRSGSRKSRVDSNQSTPTGTPNTSRPSSHIDAVGGGGKHTPFTGFGLGIVGQANKSRPNSTVGGYTGAISPGVTSQPKFGRADELQGENPMFFHANDAHQRSPELRAAQQPARKSPVFFYANGQQDEPTLQRPTSQPSPPLSSVSTKSKKSQFFHADGRADQDVPPVPSLPSPSAMHSPPQFFQAAPAFRPPSPAKDAGANLNFHLSYRKGASQIMRPSVANTVERPKTISILPPHATAGGEARKRSLGASSTGRGGRHGRTSSLSSIESGASARRTSGASLEASTLAPLDTILQAHSPVSSEPSSAPALPLPLPDRDSLGASSTSSLPNREAPTSPTLSFPPQSPTKSSQQNPFQTQLAETIMNARVERKIQDLEISNSSLMAINKSLEREVRRQHRELRRFRRLSRAGRLSTASTMLEVGTMNGEEGELSALDEVSEEDISEEEEEEEETSSSSDSDLASLSPEAIAEREERKLAKDSKRLQLDLARHRDILVDSQKLNQSLKRCMAWTEMMIKDGRKALDYRAEHDVGGRILDHEDLHAGDEGDEEDEEEARHGLLSAWTPSPGPMPQLEALDGLLGLDTSALTDGSVQSTDAMPEALGKGDFWSIANALP